MKEQELNELLDRAIGTKGNLRIPAFWMKKIFKELMEWCKGLTPKIFVPTKVSQLDNDSGYVDYNWCNNMFITASNAKSTYLSKSDASSTYATQTYVNAGIANNITNVLNNPI